MENIKKELKQGIQLNLINTNKFKTNLVGIFLTTELTKQNVTKNAVLSAVLRRGSKNLKTLEDISIELEEMYGAEFDTGIDKTGDNHILKFYIETISDEFLPNNEKTITKKALETVLDLAFNPYVEKNGFKKEYIEQEKINIKQRIEGKIDNKGRYALDRTIEEMYKGESFGLYKFGYIKDLDDINEENLYNYYLELLNECKIDIFISGLIDNNIEEEILANENIKKLNGRNPSYVKIMKDKKEITVEKVVEEKLDINQGKLVVGLDVDAKTEKEKFQAIMYNSLLGGSANSKMFQNVREKAHLAYVASSSYLKYKNNIYINCGIEIENYEKALNLVREQIEEMKKGIFTEKEIENAKKGIIDSIKAINDEQDNQITYFFGQELNNTNISLEKYIENIEKVKKEDILKIANNIKINTIYFLRN